MDKSRAYTCMHTFYIYTHTAFFWLNYLKVVFRHHDTFYIPRNKLPKFAKLVKGSAGLRTLAV